ncbi:hypothetical protein BH11ACT6_BH11ACT6_29790 [soil metagenome]
MTLPIIAWDQAYNRNGDGKLPRAVVNVIRTYMDNHTLTGWVSQETLARDTGLDESNVRRQIKKNAEAGWIVVTKRGRAGRASEYRLTYSQPGADARLEESLTGRICPVNELTPNQANMPGYTPQPGEYARLLPGADARPTTPRTSPQEKFSRETGQESRSPEGGGRTEATGVADSRGPEGPSWSEAAPAAERPADRQAESQPATASGSPLDDPFSSPRPAWVIEAQQREERAARNLEPATAGGPPASPWD